MWLFSTQHSFLCLFIMCMCLRVVFRCYITCAINQILWPKQSSICKFYCFCATRYFYGFCVSVCVCPRPYRTSVMSSDWGRKDFEIDRSVDRSIINFVKRNALNVFSVNVSFSVLHRFERPSTISSPWSIPPLKYYVAVLSFSSDWYTSSLLTSYTSCLSQLSDWRRNWIYGKCKSQFRCYETGKWIVRIFDSTIWNWILHISDVIML